MRTDRRRYIAALLGTGVLGTAGCQGAPRSAGDTPDRSDGEPAGSGDGDGGTPTVTPGSAGPEPGDTPGSGDVELPIDRSELNRGAAEDQIPAITDPAFAPDWSGVEERAREFERVLSPIPTLEEADRVIGVERDGRARAYPLSILNWHEVVNDEFAGPLLVTYCPLCGSGVTAVGRVAGEATTFGVSGFLWRSDLVLYDEATRSLWSQILATAINGPRTGEAFDLLPSTLTTWGAWTGTHPDTEVLLPPPISDTVSGRVSRNYDQNPYAGYDDSQRIGIGYNDFRDDRLHPKASVIGVADGDAVRAYPFERVDEAGVVNDAVGDRPVVVVAGAEGSLYAYDRRADGETLTFEAAGDAHLVAGGSRWEVTSGRAVDGPFDGARLARANDRSEMFWFAWLDFHPGTSLYGED